VLRVHPRWKGRRVLTLAALALLAPLAVTPPALGATSRGVTPHDVRSLTLSIPEVQGVYKSSIRALTTEIIRGEWSKTDLATLSTMRALHALASCGCLQFPTSAGPVEFTAPKEHGYPLWFEAEADEPTTECQNSSGRYFACPFVALVTFEQLRPRSSWLIANMVTYGGSTRTLKATSKATMDANGPVQVPPMLFGDLVAAFQSAGTTGSVPSTNFWAHKQPGHEPWDTIASMEASHRTDVADHYRETIKFTLAAKTATFDVSLGSLQCAAIAGSWKLTHGTFVQPANRSAYGVLLAPGRYSSITFHSVRNVCVIQEPARIGRGSGLLGDVYSITGTPA